MNIIYPLIFLCALGAVAGLLLAVASKIFYVKADETVEKINNALPGINCGACGFSGCEGYAEAVANGNAPTDLCKTGGAKANKEISAIMGVSASDSEPEIAVVRCKGSCDAARVKYNFEGVKSCAAAEMLYSGYKLCPSGCMGLGDCAAVCPHGAISVENGVAKVDERRCVGCGICVRECPNALIALRKRSAKVDYLCMSTLTAKDTIAACDNGCIACRQCERVCPVGAVKIVDNHAEVNYELCTGCGACREKCRRNVIV